MTSSKKNISKENKDENDVSIPQKKPILNYLIDLGLVISFLAVFITGVIKFPGFLDILGINRGNFPMYEVSLCMITLQ